MNTQADQANRYAAPQAEVSDEAGDEASELAGRGTRLGAVILDGLIFGLLIYTPLMIGTGLQGLAAAGRAGRTNPFAAYAVFGRAFGTRAGLFALVGLVICAALNIYFVKKNGQSVGKKLLGIKVVRTDGSAASLGRIFWLRNVVNALPSSIPFVGGLYGLIDALFIFGEPRRCVHDRIADTIVVKA